MRGDRVRRHPLRPALRLRAAAARPDLDAARRPQRCSAPGRTRSREPAFRDLYDAEGVGSVPLYRDPRRYEDPLIRPEHVNDFELGGAWRGTAGGAGLSLTANLFRMDFEDELVLRGPVRHRPRLRRSSATPRARSTRASSWRPAPSARCGRPRDSRSTPTPRSRDNHFVEYQEVYGTTPGDTLRYDGNAIGFFPATLGQPRRARRVAGCERSGSRRRTRAASTSTTPRAATRASTRARCSTSPSAIACRPAAATPSCRSASSTLLDERVRDRRLHGLRRLRRLRPAPDPRGGAVGAGPAPGDVLARPPRGRRRTGRGDG